MNIAIGAFYLKYNINNLQTIQLAQRKIHNPFTRFFLWGDDGKPLGPHYILCEPSITKAGTEYVQMKAHIFQQQHIPLIPYDEFNVLQLLPPEAYFEYMKTLMKPYGE